MMATEYKVLVDGMDIGSIQYPFVVLLKPKTIAKLIDDVAHHYRVEPKGVKVVRLTAKARRDKMAWSNLPKIKHFGKIS